MDNPTAAMDNPGMAQCHSDPLSEKVMVRLSSWGYESNH